MSFFKNLWGKFSDVIGDNITWYCDRCNSVMNYQNGFSTITGTWVCTDCGFENDVSSDNVFSSEQDYQDQMGIPHCPYCNGMVLGDAPDATVWFNCNSCCARFRLIGTELINVMSANYSSNQKVCENCGQSLIDGAYTLPWEDDDNPDGYITCPYCQHKNFEYDFDD